MSELASYAPANDHTSPLDDLLKRALPYEEMGARPSPLLLRSAVLANVALVLMLLLGHALNANRVRHSGFFPIGGDLVGGLVGFLQVLTWPLLVSAGVGLALNYWSRQQRTPPWVHIVLALQIVPTVLYGFGWISVIALFTVALILWILFIGLMIAIGAAIIGGLIASAGA